jgi:hypothetical protein
MQELSDNDLLSAYIDGELESSAREELQQRLNSELELRRQYKALLKANELFCESVDEIDQDHLPKELVSLLETPKESSDIGVWSPWSKALAAAVFIFAIVPMSYVYLHNQGNTLEQQLQTVLSTLQSGEVIEYQDQNAKFYVNFSFVNHAGELCRELNYHNDLYSKQAVRCYRNNTWQVEAEVDSPWMLQDQAYMPANVESNMAIENYIEQNIASDILTIDEEQKELQRVNQ